MADKKYNTKLAAMWAYQDGKMYLSMPVDDLVFDAIQGVEKGGKLVLKILNAESRSSEKSPYAYLEFISKDDVDAFNARRVSGKGKSRDSRVTEESDGI